MGFTSGFIIGVVVGVGISAILFVLYNELDEVLSIGNDGEE